MTETDEEAEQREAEVQQASTVYPTVPRWRPNTSDAVVTGQKKNHVYPLANFSRHAANLKGSNRWTTSNQQQEEIIYTQMWL